MTKCTPQTKIFEITFEKGISSVHSKDSTPKKLSKEMLTDPELLKYKPNKLLLTLTSNLQKPIKAALLYKPTPNRKIGIIDFQRLRSTAIMIGAIRIVFLIVRAMGRSWRACIRRWRLG